MEEGGEGRRRSKEGTYVELNEEGIEGREGRTGWKIESKDENGMKKKDK